MKMAKPSSDDIESLARLMHFLDALHGGMLHSPRIIVKDGDGEDYEDVPFDIDDRRDMRQAFDGLMKRMDSLTGWQRVVGTVAMVLDPRNEVIDPDADTVEHHPKKRALEGRVARLDGALSDIEKLLGENGCDCECHPEELDACERCFACRVSGVVVAARL